MEIKHIMKSYMRVVAEILNHIKPEKILDAPSGSGWLSSLLTFNPIIDGIDLFEEKPKNYNKHIQTDLNNGIPNESEKYNAIVSCEGIEHIGNPLLFFQTIKEHLLENGLLIITTPNIWYPGSKIKYMVNGFFPSFPPLVTKIQHGTHMHIMPWNYPQLYLYLKISGYKNIKLHSIKEKKPKHFHEKIFGIPQKVYCKNKLKKSITEEEREFWYDAGSDQSIFGRRLVVSATI